MTVNFLIAGAPVEVVFEAGPVVVVSWHPPAKTKASPIALNKPIDFLMMLSL